MENKTNGFRQLQQRLSEMGWYVGWARPCCQTCAWMELPDSLEQGPLKGQEIDYDKVLFNHEQDCDIDCEYDQETDKIILPEGVTRDDYDTFPHYSPEQQNSSLFCFSGEPEGVENLKAILPIIEECGCSWDWNETANMRIQISWSL